MTKKKGPRYGGLPENVYWAHKDYWERHLARPGEGWEEYLASRGWKAGWWAWSEEDEETRVWQRRYRRTETKWRHMQRPGKGSPRKVREVEALAKHHGFDDPVAYLTWVSLGLPLLDSQSFGPLPNLDYESLAGGEM